MHAAGRESFQRPFPHANYPQRSKQADVKQGQHQSLQKESTADSVGGGNHHLVSLSSAVAMASQIRMDPAKSPLNYKDSGSAKILLPVMSFWNSSMPSDQCLFWNVKTRDPWNCMWSNWSSNCGWGCSSNPPNIEISQIMNGYNLSHWFVFGS